MVKLPASPVRLTDRDLDCLRDPRRAHSATRERLRRLGLLRSCCQPGAGYRPALAWNEPTEAGLAELRAARDRRDEEVEDA